jgi:hypothetical protein
MIENYTQLAPGHWYQENLTGSLPDYSSSYSKTRYDTYKTTDLMSQLRYHMIVKAIGEFNSILDFGYGNGSFMRYCHGQGKNVSGYDVSDYPVPKGSVKVTDPDSIEVDVMTFFDSLEHLQTKNLVSFLNNKKVKHFVISVPWMHESMGSWWFENWKHRRENEHIHHFDAHGLISLLTHCNCSIVHVGNDEDKIRTPFSNLPNILTVIATKK